MHKAVERAADLLIACFQKGGSLLLCGNGGSAADCAHIAGELCKGFLLPRRPEQAFTEAVGEPWAARLQQGLRAIDLTANTALITAIINDIGGEDIFAQQVMAFGRPGDILLGISTSGNAENVRRAMLAARARGLATIAMTGAGGGRLAQVCDLLVESAQRETRSVQEEQIGQYHSLCMLIEEALFK